MTGDTIPMKYYSHSYSKKVGAMNWAKLLGHFNLVYFGLLMILHSSKADWKAQLMYWASRTNAVGVTSRPGNDAKENRLLSIVLNSSVANCNYSSHGIEVKSKRDSKTIFAEQKYTTKENTQAEQC